MKNAYIITNSEMTEILKGYLSDRGYDVSRLTVRFTSTNAVVAGIKEPGVTMAPAEVPELEDQFDDEIEEDEDGGFNLAGMVREQITAHPMTAAALALALDVATYQVMDTLGEVGAEAVAPAREDGRTVSKWMVPGTEAYDQFVAQERARIEGQVEKWGSKILLAVPKFYQRGIERPQIVETMCETLDYGAAEELGRDAKAMFYRMAELGQLEHVGHAWRAGKTESDRVNVASLQGAVREVLISAEDGLDRKQIAEKLPGFVDDNLLRHAIKGMDGVYEQCGLLYHS